MTEQTQWDSRLLHRQHEGAVCVRFQDRKIVEMAQIEAMSEELSELSAGDGARLVVNLDGVEFLSSAALNKLVSLERKLRGRDGRLALCSLTLTVKDVFVITRLENLFAIYDTESAALQALSN